MSNLLLRCNDFSEQICPVCGKRFYSTPEWVYMLREKNREIYFCTWGCFRKAQNEELVKNKRTTLDNNQKEALNQMIVDGYSNQEISRKFCVNVQLVNYYRSKMIKYDEQGEKRKCRCGRKKKSQT